MTEPQNDDPVDVTPIGTPAPSEGMVSSNGAKKGPIETTVPHTDSLVSQNKELSERELESTLSMDVKALEPSDERDSKLTDDYMVIGLFDSPDALMRAIGSLRAKGIRHLEAYTPYPIHGIDDALGLKRSPLGAMVMVMGIIGALTALGFQFWISAIDYPIVTGGKPPWSWEAFVPIMFEVTVLFATFTAGLGMLFLLNRLPFFGHPVINSKSMARITRDQYALAVERDEATGTTLDTFAAKEAFQAVGAISIETVPSPAKAPIFTSEFILRSLGAIVSACLVAALLMYWTIKLFPELPPMSHMLEQPKLLPQQSSKFFRDGHGMRLPPKGTVARGYLGLGSVSQNDAASLVNPLPRNLESLEIGKRKFTERCAVCHGALANGVASLTAAYGGKPANLQSEQFRKYTDGQIYWVIVNGKNAMPSHAADLSPDQRWAVVHYVRALQRAQDAKDSDLNP
jgi:mono/diheme cytochrome c family protein